jgi:hypothetical protein
MGIKEITSEHESTWKNNDVIKWKETARGIIKSYYLSFRGSQFDEYIIDEDDKLLLAKICFAVYGEPTEAEAEDIWEGYKKEKRKNCKEILKTILNVHKKKNGKKNKKLLVGIIVVACKEKSKEFVMPVFSVFTGINPCDPSAKRTYVDTERRVYKTWDKWKNNNKMPMLKYAYPRRGFFTCSQDHAYEFDEEKEPDIEFGNSPACFVTRRIIGTTDNLSTILAITGGAIAISAMFTPIGPFVALGAVIVGGCTAGYKASRNLASLYDRRK